MPTQLALMAYKHVWIILLTATASQQFYSESRSGEGHLDILLSDSGQSCPDSMEAVSQVYFSIDEIYSSLLNISTIFYFRRNSSILVHTPCKEVIQAVKFVSQLTHLSRKNSTLNKSNSSSDSIGFDSVNANISALDQDRFSVRLDNSRDNSAGITANTTAEDPSIDKKRPSLNEQLGKRHLADVETFIYSSQHCSPLRTYRSQVTQAVAAILEYNLVCSLYLFSQGDSLQLNDLIPTGCRRVVYDVNSLNISEIRHFISSLDFDDSAVILAAGSRNRELFLLIKKNKPSIYIKVFLVLNEEGENSTQTWNDAASFGDRLILMDINGITNTKCLSLSKPDHETKIDIQYYSQEEEKLEYGGFWNSLYGLKLVRRNLWHFKKFRHKDFRISSIFLPVFHYYEEDEKGERKWKGLAIDLLDSLAKSLNFTFSIYETPDKKWGAMSKNGQWNGMVNQVIQGFADFAVAKFTVNHERATSIDFVTPFWYESAVMVMRRPKENKVLNFVRPLSDIVWVCMFASLPVMGATVFLTTYLHDDDVTGPACDRKNLVKMYYHFKRGLTYAYGASMHQSMPWIPETLSFRITFVFWWFSVIAMVAIYTGSLTAVLAVPKSPSPIDTLEELAEQTKYKYGPVASTALERLFASDTLPQSHVYKRLYDGSIQYPENLVTSHRTGIERALKEDYVYIGEYSGVTPYVFKDCNLVMGKQHFYPTSFAWVFPDESPYTSIFSRRILQMTDGGIIKYLRSKHYPKNKCHAAHEENKSTEKKASLADTQGAFIILFTGVCFSAIILSFEWIYKLSSKVKYFPEVEPSTSGNA